MNFYCDAEGPIVTTDKGRLRGYRLDEIYTFRGIEYAKAARFRWPEETEAWDGVKDALNYGNVCPLMFPDSADGDIAAPHRMWVQNENCQNLNVWTPTLDAGAKLPVMVWLHGGGFFAGSAIEQEAYDGTNMSRCGNVVTVTVNHRLNVLGYLDLRGFDEAHERAVNCGNGDLIAALKWVRRNIEQFGGDPENVTIFGQSGGGGKVITLMQMPEADGLFAKGIIMSGTLGEVMTDPMIDMKPVIRKTMEYLGMQDGDISRLDTAEYHELADAFLRAHAELVRAKGLPYFGPRVSGDYTGDPMKIGFTESAAKKPVLIGSVISEFFHSPYQDSDTSDEEMVKILEESFGAEDAKKLIDSFRAAYPDRRLYDIYTVDAEAFRYWTKKWIAKRMEDQCSGKTWNYLFTMQFPFNGGSAAWHCSDIPFFFHNIDRVPVVNVEGISNRLQEQMFGAFMSFAHTSDPNHSALPAWPACTGDREATMIFDTESEVRYNFDDAFIHESHRLRVNTLPFGG